LLADAAFTFGIDNVFNAAPPFSADWFQRRHTHNKNPLGRFYYMSVEEKF
jgi:hypothetical protein